MIDRRRKLPALRVGSAVVPARNRAAPTPVYLARAGAALDGVYRSDHGDGNSGARLKWLFSTCLAAAVGVCAIGFAIYGSMDHKDANGVLASFERVRREALQPQPNVQRRGRELRAAGRKTDLMQASTRGLSTKHIIHDTLRQQKESRQFITIKPYARVVARLATRPPPNTDLIPSFNPFILYANTEPVGGAKDRSGKSADELRVAIKVLELVGGFLPAEDGQELRPHEVATLVAQMGEENNGPSMRTSFAGAGTVAAISSLSANRFKLPKLGTQRIPPRTSILVKNVMEAEADDGSEEQETRIVKVRKGDTLIGLLRRTGAESWQARAIVEAAKSTLGEASLEIGEELHLSLVPSPTKQYGLEPVRVSLFGGGQRHKFTVIRNDAGDYVASRNAVTSIIARMLRQSTTTRRASLYKSIYHASLVHKLPPEMIMRVLRIHAYDTDFKRRVGPGDSFEIFFDMEDDGKGGEGNPSELLYTSITVGGESRRFYRYRSPSGVVDFYDENGSSAKKFLMRKPVKGGTVRFTSGFGYRIHPLLRRRKMHTGVDWAAKPGTPILAAGDAVVEAAGRKGGYGNYIRLRHANGYKTTYSHMRRIEKGVVKGIKVQQGQVIGYVGSTGLSSGPHLHFEVLVNNRHVDPMRIHVPRGQQLQGKQLAEFQKARIRIGELMRKSPVTTRVAQIDSADVQ